MTTLNILFDFIHKQQTRCQELLGAEFVPDKDFFLGYSAALTDVMNFLNKEQPDV